MAIDDTFAVELLHPNMSYNNINFDERFTYEILTEKYADQVVKVFTEAFCRSEPMTKFLEMDEERYAIFARAVTEQAIADGLSIVALEENQVVAIALTEDLAKPGPLPDFDPKFEYILALLENLGKNFFENKIFPPGQIAHLFITAVAENYRHLGLSKQVNFRAMDLAYQKGFDFIYCELTNYYNEKGIISHLKNPKRLIGTIFYPDFKHKDTMPFANLAGGADSYLWAIRPNVELVYMLNGKKVREQL